MRRKGERATSAEKEERRVIGRCERRDSLFPEHDLSRIARDFVDDDVLGGSEVDLKSVVVVVIPNRSSRILFYVY